MSESQLSVTVSSTTKKFKLAPSGSGRGVQVNARPWQPGDKKTMWRVPLHPWTGGLNVDRITGRGTYAKANADASNDGLLLHPPLLADLTFTNGTAPNKIVELNGDIYVLAGRYVQKITASNYSVTEDKDFGAGLAGVDMVVFNNEIIVAMGPSTPIFKRTTTTWSQASDNTYAIALGVVGEKLWRAESPNLISSCTTTPLTLASWTPASPSQYPAGDTTNSIKSIIDYGGIPWVGRAEGMFAPDPQSRFLNQTPQLQRYPDATYNAIQPWTAWGYLWVPSVAGLMRIKPGESKVFGPEITNRPGYRFRVKSGVEFGGAVYLLCQDGAASANTFVCKMVRDEEQRTGKPYIFHEFVRLGGTSTGHFIGVSTLPTNPTIIVGYGDDCKYFKLGRGAGRDVDDSNYAFGTAMELETGVFIPGPDRSVVSQPVGVEVTLDYAGAGESLSLSGSVDGQAYVNLLDTQEGGGSQAITSTTNIETKRRYFPASTQGQHVEIKFASTLTSASGTNRPEIYEAWCFGFSHPKMLDTITCRVLTGSFTQRSGMTRKGILDYFRYHMDAGTEVQIEVSDYEEGNTLRAFITGVTDMEALATPADPKGAVVESAIEIEFTRSDHGPLYAADVPS